MRDAIKERDTIKNVSVIHFIVDQILICALEKRKRETKQKYDVENEKDLGH